LKQGDLAKTVQQLGALQGRAADTFADWRNSAAARVAADRALSELTAAAPQTIKTGG
jgi:hypothetical protein